MTQPMLLLSPKFKDFLKIKCEREFLEGVTACGKTTVGIFKFMCLVANSEKRFHVIGGADLGTVEKNVINGERMLLDQFNGLAEYYPSGRRKIRLPHVEYQTNKGTKIIYICGYDNKKRWQKVLGGQVGCVYIDEVNIADMEFLREISHRCEYMMTTSNPDDPNLPVYKEFLNRSRPLKKYINDYPSELLEMLDEPHVKGWVHWYFGFHDNAALTKEMIQRKIDAVAPGTKMYKNKILGLRGRATGLVFDLVSNHIITPQQAMKFKYVQFSCGVDTSYSRLSDDKIAFIFIGITESRLLVVLSEEVYNNRDIVKSGKRALAPSDIPSLLVSFLECNRKRWVEGGDAYARDVFIDSADQATMNECLKYNNEIGTLYDFYNSWKKLTIIDRIQLQQGWMKIKDEVCINGVQVCSDFLVVDECGEYIREMNTYSWKEDKNEPEDANDHTHNACQYAWIPHKHLIGRMVPNE